MNTATQLHASWDPIAYAQFPEYRIRPALDLLAHVKMHEPNDIIDLGCGPGHLTALMSERWPNARFIGVDSSSAMFTKAAENQDPRFQWIQADVVKWQPQHPVDLVFVNSLLHLVPHDALIERLFSFVKPGGVVAIQMPVCAHEPWFQLMGSVLQRRDDAGQPLGDAQLQQEIMKNHVKPQLDYYQQLSPYCETLSIWDTHYLQVLDGDEPVYEWVKAAGLRPIVTHLTADNLALFLAHYRQELQREYPAQSNGNTLFPFIRRFIVGKRAS